MEENIARTAETHRGGEARVHLLGWRKPPWAPAPSASGAAPAVLAPDGRTCSPEGMLPGPLAQSIPEGMRVAVKVREGGTDAWRRWEACSGPLAGLGSLAPHRLLPCLRPPHPDCHRCTTCLMMRAASSRSTIRSAGRPSVSECVGEGKAQWGWGWTSAGATTICLHSRYATGILVSAQRRAQRAHSLSPLMCREFRNDDAGARGQHSDDAGQDWLRRLRRRAAGHLQAHVPRGQ